MQYTERTARYGAPGGLGTGFKGQKDQEKKIRFYWQTCLTHILVLKKL